MTRCVEVAKAVIVAFLSTGENATSYNDLYDINSGDKKVLLQHIKALHSIFESAIDDLEKETNNGR